MCKPYGFLTTNTKSNSTPSLRKKKIFVFPSLIRIRGTINAQSPLPHWQSRPERAEAGRAEAQNSRVMTRPRYFSPGFGTQPQHPRGLPGGGGETHRPRPPPRPAQPSRGASGLGAGGSRRAARGGDAPRGRGREPGSTHAPGGGTGAVAASFPFKNWKGGRGGGGKDLAPRFIRKPAGRQEMTKAEVVQVRSVTGSRASGPDSGGKSPERSSLAACRLRSQQREWTRVPAPPGPRAGPRHPAPPPARALARPAGDSRGRGEGVPLPAPRPPPWALRLLQVQTPLRASLGVVRNREAPRARNADKKPKQPRRQREPGAAETAPSRLEFSTRVLRLSPAQPASGGNAKEVAAAPEAACGHLVGEHYILYSHELDLLPGETGVTEPASGLGRVQVWGVGYMWSSRCRSPPYPVQLWASYITTATTFPVSSVK